METGDLIELISSSFALARYGKVLGLRFWYSQTSDLKSLNVALSSFSEGIKTSLKTGIKRRITTGALESTLISNLPHILIYELLYDKENASATYKLIEQAINYINESSFVSNSENSREQLFALAISLYEKSNSIEKSLLKSIPRISLGEYEDYLSSTERVDYPKYLRFHEHNICTNSDISAFDNWIFGPIALEVIAIYKVRVRLELPGSPLPNHWLLKHCFKETAVRPLSCPIANH